MPLKHHIGCTYRHDGVFRENLQLLNERGHAVAILDLVEGTAQRYARLDNVASEADQWRDNQLKERAKPNDTTRARC